MMGRILAVARNTFREAIRNKVLYALLFFALLLILAGTAVGRLALQDEVKVILDLGLAATSLLSIVIAVFVGVNLIYKELERKTIYVIVARPVRREEFLVGRYLGTLETMFVIVASMALVLQAVVLARGGSWNGRLVRAEVLVFLEVAVISAVALLFSSFSSPFLSGLFTLLIFVAGRMVPDIQQLADRFGPGPAGFSLQAAAKILPNGRLFTVSGAMLHDKWVSIHGQFVTWGYVGRAALYALFYSVTVLILAALIFRRRDLT